MICPITGAPRKEVFGMTDKEREQYELERESLLARGLPDAGLVSCRQVAKALRRKPATVKRMDIWCQREFKGGREWLYTTTNRLARYFAQRT